MRIVVIVLVAAGLALWLLWPERTPRERAAPRAPEASPALPEPAPAAPAKPDLDALLKELETGYPLEALRKLEKLGPAAAAAAPVLAERLRAGEHGKDEYERENPGTLVNWGPSTFYVRSALVAIGPAAIPHVAKLLSDPLRDVRYHAGEVLQDLDAVDALLAACRSPSAVERAHAVGLLGEMAGKHPETLSTVVDLLADPDRKVRGSATQALGGYGAPAAGYLAERVVRPEFMEAYCAAKALAGSPAAARLAVPALATALSHRIDNVRWDAAKALARVGPEAAPAIPALIRQLGDKHRYSGEAAATALARIGDASVGPLRAALADENPLVRARAMSALSRIDGAGDALVPHYVRQLDDLADREAAALALARLGLHAERTLPILRPMLTRDWYKADDYVLLLAYYKKDAAHALPVLFDAFAVAANESKANWFRNNAYKVLKTLAPHAPEAVVEALGHASEDVRDAAYHQLRRLHDKAVPALRTATRDKRPHVRAAAARLLAPHARERAAVLEALQDPHWRVRAAAASGLIAAHTELERAVPVLVKVMAAYTGDAWELLEYARPLGRLEIAEGAFARDLLKTLDRKKLGVAYNPVETLLDKID